MVRESVFAYLFGAGFATDAFNVAFRIPNFLRDLFAESALSAAFVPAFVESLRNQDRERTWRFASNMLSALALVTAVLSLAGVLAAPAIVRLIALGFAAEPAKLALTAALTHIMFPFLFFVALAAWAMGVLNACGSFFVPATAPAAFNVFSVLVPVLTFGLFRARGLDPIHGMAWGVLAGALAQFAVQVPSLVRRGFRYRAVLDFRSTELVRVFRRWLPMVFGFATWQVNFLINTFLLTFLPEGSVTWVNYAYRIQHLPAGLFGAAIGSVALAEYSHGVAGADRGAMQDRFRHALSLVSMLTLPAAVLLIVLAVPVTRLVYEHGAFGPADTACTAQALALYCLGIWAAAATRNVAAGFYATGDTRTPALVALGVVGANIALNLVLMRVIGFRSFPLAASVTQAGNFTLLLLILRSRHPGLGIGRLARQTGLTLLAALAAGGAARLAAAGGQMLLPSRHVMVELLQLVGAGGLGLVVYYSVARLLGLAELGRVLRDVASPLLRRSKRLQP